MRGLGGLQRNILVAVWNATEAGRSERAWGVRWGSLLPRNKSRSLSAAASRALRQLERRGLVRRRNQVSGDRHQSQQPVEIGGQVWTRIPPPEHHRSTHVELTDAGVVIARALAEKRAMR